MSKDVQDHFELLLTPLTYIAFDLLFIVQYFTHAMYLNTFDTSDIKACLKMRNK